MTRTLKLAVIPGDGVTDQCLKVLDAFKVEWVEYDLFPESALDELSEFDAILAGVLDRKILHRLRVEFDQYLNVSPIRRFPGVASPLTGDREIDFVVVREATEGAYAENGGALRAGTPHEVASEVTVNSVDRVESVVRAAFRHAQERPRRKLTLVHKSNILVHTARLWERVFRRAAEDFPDVNAEYLHVDAAAMFVVDQPERFDVIVTDGLFGDVLGGLGVAVTGSGDLSVSAEINPGGEFPSLFRPAYNTHPELAGHDTADPRAAVLAAAMMLAHLGLTSESARIEAAVAADLATQPQGSPRGTAAIGDALAHHIASVAVG